ncbi:MAG: hypothetical protein F6J86_41040 [Symploca sp. SIO1B1]|nr:hypothetical protein [Symploca sp. SIO1B1]
MPRKKYKRHTRKERTKKPENFLLVLGSLLKKVLGLVMEAVLGLVMALGQLLWLGLVGLMLWLSQLLWLWPWLGAVVVLLWLWLWLGAKGKGRRRYSTISKLVPFLPDESLADLNTLHYQLAKQKCPKWLIEIRTTMCFLNMCRGWILAKLEDIWSSMDLRL